MKTKVLFSSLFVALAQATDYLVEWKIREYPDLAVVPGDTITWTWTGTHDVYIHPGGQCEMTVDRIRVRKNSPAVYTFTEDDAEDYGKPMLFVCDIGSHCELGQNIRVKVYDTLANKCARDDTAVDCQETDASENGNTDGGSGETEDDTGDGETEDDTGDNLSSESFNHAYTFQILVLAAVGTLFGF